MLGAVAATVACSAAQPGSPVTPANTPAEEVAAPASSAAAGTEESQQPEAAAQSAAAPAVPGAESGPASPAFPPPDVTPPYARSAAEGDGRWIAYSAAGNGARAGQSPAFAITKIHPHTASRFIEVTIVAIDLGKVSVHFMPGSEDLGGVKVPFAAGLVPESERGRLLAVFNGGFQPRHGRWGMMRGGATVLPPRDEGCTLALYSDGSVRLRSWTKLAAPDGAELNAFRQTPPCLVEEGAVHPDLLAGRDKAWKGQTPGIVTRRRSAIGLDASGKLLFYGIGIEAPPRLLAEALLAAGARNAAELDINWNWTRFFLYTREQDGKPRFATSLAPGEHSKSAYVERASERDFFYVLER